MYDRNHSELEAPKEFPLAPAATVAEEGQLFIFVDDGAGGSALSPSTGIATDRLAGFASSDAFLHTTRSVVEEATVPAAGPFTVQLENSNLVGAAGTDIRVRDITAGVDLVFNALVGPGQFNLNYGTGVLTFNAAEASNVLEITYRYNLTVNEALVRYQEAPVHRYAQSFFSQLAVHGGKGLIYTNQYDTAQAWAVGDPVFAGANGQLVGAGPGPQIGFVHATPVVGLTDSDMPGMLGVRFLF
jgi:hypothetical protein